MYKPNPLHLANQELDAEKRNLKQRLTKEELEDIYPAIWLSGVSELAFEDLIIDNKSVGIRIGFSVQQHSEPPVTGYIRFRRVYVDLVGMAEAHLPYLLPPELRPPQGDPELRREYIWTSVGPAVEARWALWVTFDNCVFVNITRICVIYSCHYNRAQKWY